jgi:CDP-diacylglycerol--serine O-phosphatidyltransferase
MKKFPTLPDCITLTNAFVGMLAVMYIFDSACKLGACLILLAIVLDGIDGRIAKILKKQHELGRYLDSAADNISFCIAPAVLLYKSYYKLELGTAFTSLENALVVLVVALIIVFGTIRLARFAYQKEDKLNYFLGLPTAAFALFIVILYSIAITTIFLIILGLLSVLLISKFRYPKIESAYLVGSIFAVLLTFLALLLSRWELAVLPLCLILVYLLVVPYFRRVEFYKI